MAVTINDIARLAGVSKATISAVLNDKPGISEQTRERVQEIVKKLNYRPNQLARSLSIRKTKSIGLVIKEIDNPFFSKVMKGVFDTCSGHGYTVLLGSSELSPAKEIQSIRTLLNQRVAGLIISPLQGEDVDFSYISDLNRDNYPFVMLNRVKNFSTNVVEIDNAAAAYRAVSHLIGKGHTRIAYFSGPSYSAHAHERLEGYRKAFMEKHLTIHQEDVIEVGSYIENGYQTGKMFFPNHSNRISAVLCYNDLVAIGLINALTELEIRVPEAVSVIGFDDIDFCESIKVPLTTIRIPSYQIGELAAKMLIDCVNNAGQHHPERIVIDTHLIERASVARCPKNRD